MNCAERSGLARGLCAWGLGLGLALAIAVGPVSAADLGGGQPGSLKDESEYGYPFSWTGTYAGLQLGYGWADTDARSGPTTGLNQSYTYDGDGFLGGAHIGFNFQNQNVVYGLEADMDFADLASSALGSLGDGHSTDIDWMGSLRARLGFASGRNLFYVTGGWAFADVNVTSETNAISYSDVRHGWTLGGGMEHAFSQNMTARLEYRYTDFGSASGGGVGLVDNSDVTLHAIRDGVSIKF